MNLIEQLEARSGAMKVAELCELRLDASEENNEKPRVNAVAWQ